MPDVETHSGMKIRMTYQVRSGRCPKCGTLFDDSEHPRRPDDSRYCPGCKQYRLGKSKGAGEVNAR